MAKDTICNSDHYIGISKSKFIQNIGQDLTIIRGSQEIYVQYPASSCSDQLKTCMRKRLDLFIMTT